MVLCVNTAFMTNAVLLAVFFKNTGQKQDKNLENTGQFTVHIESYVVTVPNDQSLQSPNNYRHHPTRVLQ